MHLTRKGCENLSNDHRGGCALILTKILSTNFFFQKIYGDESGEFACEYWDFKC